MLNDWKWEKIDNNQYIIKDNYNTKIVDLQKIQNEEWLCTFYNNEMKLHYNGIYPANMSLEEVQWQAILWIQKQCNQIANSFHHIRDHLPSIHEVYCTFLDKKTKL